MHAEAVGPDVYAIDTGFVRPQLAAAHLLMRGGEAAFVDPGPAPGVPQLLAALVELGIAPAAVRYVCVTHVHLDHAGGAGALLAHLPAATVVAHPRAVRHLVDPARLIEGARAVWGVQRMAALYGTIVPVPPERIVAAPDGFETGFAGTTLRFLDTPGHARHHYCIHDPAGDAVYSGDTLGMAYRELASAAGPFLIPTTTPVQFDPQALHASVDRLLALAPQRAYLMHYSVVEAPQRLGAALHAQVDAHVAAARALAGVPDFETRLAQRLLDGWLEALAGRGCSLPRETQAALLRMDAELNAQGLAVWLEQAGG